MEWSNLADRVTEYVLYLSMFFFGIVLLLMLFNKNRNSPRPPLDSAFIMEKSALFGVVTWSVLRINGYLGPSDIIRLMIWSMLGLSEALVLWFIYLERFGRGSFMRVVRRTYGYVYETVQRFGDRFRNPRFGLSSVRKRSQ